MPRYEVRFSVEGWVEAESEEKVTEILDEHLNLYLGEVPHDLEMPGHDLEITEEK